MCSPRLPLRPGSKWPSVTEVIYPDGEAAAIAWLVDAMASRWPGCTVGLDLPDNWKPSSAPHVQVALDGTPSAVHPIEAYQTVRVTAWAGNAPAAKQLCGRAHAALLAHPGGNGVGRVQFLTGVQPAKDPTTGGHVASATVRITVRATNA